MCLCVCVRVFVHGESEVLVRTTRQNVHQVFMAIYWLLGLTVTSVYMRLMMCAVRALQRYQQDFWRCLWVLETLHSFGL
jgi:hypothetical protein